MTETTIYVRLLDEAVDVWRPARAVHVTGEIYRLSEQPYDQNIETWEYVPGDQVVGKMLELEGSLHLVAVGRADR